MTGVLRSRGITAALAWVVLLSLAPPAAAQRGWSGTPTALAQITGFGSWFRTELRIAFDPSGNGIAVWTRYDFIPDNNETVQASRYTASTGAWSSPVTLSSPTLDVYRPRLGMDGHGNAVVAWQRGSASGEIIEAVRFTAASGTWSSPVDIGGGANGVVYQVAAAVSAGGDAFVMWERSPSLGLPSSVQAVRLAAGSATWGSVTQLSSSTEDAGWPTIGADPAGNAVAVWTSWTLGSGAGFVRAARYSPGTGSWGAQMAIVSGAGYQDPQVAIDASGNAVAGWSRSDAIEAARYDVTADSWGPVTVLAAAGAHSGPSIAVNAQGKAAAVWGESQVIRGATSDALTGTWTTPAILSGATTFPSLHDVAVDETGNSVAVWLAGDGVTLAVQTSRFTTAFAAWIGPTPLSQPWPTGHGGWPSVAVDAAGNVAVVWAEGRPGASSVLTRRWDATPPAPFITAVSPGAGTLSIGLAAQPTLDPTFAPQTYQYSLDGGGTWLARSPASPASPIVIGGLVDFTHYTLRVRAVNVAGTGLASPQLAAIPGTGPESPSSLVATTVAGNTVSLAWAPPAVGLVPVGYVLEGGVVPGQVLASIPTGSAAPAFTFAAPSGTFFVRVHAVTPLSRSAASNEIQIFVNVPAPPSAPLHLLGVVNGPALALSWTNTYGGGAPTGLQLHVTGTINAVLPLGLTETFAAPVVPPGTYTIRLAATNASGVSAPSNPVTLTVPGACSGVPGVPTRVVATKSGAAVRVAWSPPDAGAAVSAYWLLVGGSFVGAFPTTARTLAGTVGPGTYAFAVVAVNACGAGAQSPQVFVTVP